MKYKLFRKDFQIWKREIAILPYITIQTDSLLYTEKNFAICFGWIVWHGRFLWLAKGERA